MHDTAVSRRGYCRPRNLLVNHALLGVNCCSKHENHIWVVRHAPMRVQSSQICHRISLTPISPTSRYHSPCIRNPSSSSCSAAFLLLLITSSFTTLVDVLPWRSTTGEDVKDLWPIRVVAPHYTTREVVVIPFLALYSQQMKFWLRFI